MHEETGYLNDPTGDSWKDQVARDLRNTFLRNGGRNMLRCAAEMADVRIDARCASQGRTERHVIRAARVLQTRGGQIWSAEQGRPDRIGDHLCDL